MGSLPRWTRWLLVGASVLTFFAARQGVKQLVAYGDWPLDGNGSAHGDAVGVVIAVLLAAAWIPAWRMSRELRVAIVLPAIQIIAIGIAGVVWMQGPHRLPRAWQSTPYLELLPPAFVLGAGTIATFATGAVIAIRRRRQRLQATVTFALLNLLLLGLWLPMVVSFHGREGDFFSVPHELTASWQFAAAVLAPPYVLAAVLTALAIRRPALAQTWRLWITSVLAFGVLSATSARMGTNYFIAVMYSNFAHVLLALGIVAAVALIALGVSLALRARRGRTMLARGTLTGTIVDDDPSPVAWFRIAGWLRAAEVISRPFEVITDAGRVAISAGVEVVCNPPPSSTVLASGHSVIVLRPGDHIELAGFAKADDDSPYRGSAGFVPSSHGAWVGPTTAREPAFATMALAMWRPCVAYLLVTAAVMLPALAGLLAK